MPNYISVKQSDELVIKHIQINFITVHVVDVSIGDKSITKMMNYQLTYEIKQMKSGVIKRNNILVVAFRSQNLFLSSYFKLVCGPKYYKY